MKAIDLPLQHIYFPSWFETANNDTRALLYETYDPPLR